MNDNSKRNPLLSICIPTFNRAIYLKDNLINILSQIESYKDDVELLVSDNHSTDGTQELLLSLKEKSSVLFEYSINEENIGGSKNIHKLVDCSCGKYILLMGDDDVISPDFISILIRILKGQKDLGLIFFNRLVGNKDLTSCGVCDAVYNNCEIKLAAKEFVLEVMDRANFISSIVFNRLCWEKGDAHVDDFRYFGYSWYARLYWGAVELDMPCYYYYMPLVIQRDGEKTWLKFWPQYYLGSMSNLFWDLNDKVPGVYAKWSEKLRTVTKPTLEAMIPYREYYRQEKIKKLIQKHLTKGEIRRMNFYLSFPLVPLIYRIKNKIQRIF